MIDHSVAQGDCVSSIAAQHGFIWTTIWEHPRNAELKALRGNPNVLFPGDVVHVPDKRERQESKATDSCHMFLKKATPARVRLRLLDFERQSRAGLRYKAVVDGKHTEGSTDGEGYLTVPIQPGATRMKLTVIDGTREERYDVKLGGIDPLDTLSGVQHRLMNLGYTGCAEEIGTLGDATCAALIAFQREKGLPETGELDDTTRQQLEPMHGC